MKPEDFKRWRKEMGFSQKQAATALDVSSVTIENWERGHRLDGKPAPISLVVAYACTAMFHKMNPWSE